jgi:hypothetical protein
MFSGDGNPQFWFRQWSRAAVVPRLNNSYTLAVSESGNGKLQHIGQQWHRDVCSCTNFSALRPLNFCTILLLRLVRAVLSFGRHFISLGSVILHGDSPAMRLSISLLLVAGIFEVHADASTATSHASDVLE